MSDWTNATGAANSVLLVTNTSTDHRVRLKALDLSIQNACWAVLYEGSTAANPPSSANYVGGTRFFGANGGFWETQNIDLETSTAGNNLYIYFSADPGTTFSYKYEIIPD